MPTPGGYVMGGELAADVVGGSAFGMGGAQGAYIGDSSASRQIECGFLPELVFVHRQITSGTSANNNMWFRGGTSHAAAGAGSSRMDGGGSILFTNGIIELNATGFKIGNNNGVNSGGMLYHYYAFPAQAGLETGHYVGDGVAGRAIAVTFAPSAVFVGNQAQDCDLLITGMTTIPSEVNENARWGYGGVHNATGIRSLTGAGFTVSGNDLDINFGGKDYYWVAMAAPFVETGQYDGDGTDHRTISVSFTPSLVWVTPFGITTEYAGQSFIAYIKDGMHASGYSQIANDGACSPVLGDIEELVATGFQVGVLQNHDTVGTGNEAGIVLRHFYIAFNPGPALIVTSVAHVADRTAIDHGEAAIILAGTSIAYPVYYALQLPDQPETWTRAIGVPVRDDGTWICRDTELGKFVFGFHDEKIYLGDVTAGVMTATLAAASLDAGDKANYAIWLGELMGDSYAGCYIVAADNALYQTSDRFATIKKIRPAAGFPALPAGAKPKMVAASLQV